MPDALLVLNAGSSSLKFSRLHRASRRGSLAARPARGARDPAALRRARARTRSLPSGHGRTARTLGHEGAIEHLFDWGRRAALLGARSVVAVGHRVVHGGTRFSEPVLVDAADARPSSRRSFRWRRCTSRTTWPPSAPSRRRAPARAAGRLLRHRVSPDPAARGAGVRPAPPLLRGGRPPLRLSRPVLRVHRLGAPEAAPAAAARPHGRRPPRQRREHVRAAGGHAASPPP